MKKLTFESFKAIIPELLEIKCEIKNVGYVFELLGGGKSRFKVYRDRNSPDALERFGYTKRCREWIRTEWVPFIHSFSGEFAKDIREIGIRSVMMCSGGQPTLFTLDRDYVFENFLKVKER